jgi:uncharacterized protein GlcG (DUF336 family)
VVGGRFITSKEQIMHRRFIVLSLVVAVVGITGIGPAPFATLAQEGTPAAGTETLTDEELQEIIDAAVAAAEQTLSLLRVDAQGAPSTTRMHIAIVDRTGQLLTLHSMEDAWSVSIDIALAKAYTAASVSSNENAISSRSIGLLTQPGGALWNVGNSNNPGTGDDTIEERGLIEFPGGLALYQNGVLVGKIGGRCTPRQSMVVAGGSYRWPTPARSEHGAYPYRWGWRLSSSKVSSTIPSRE